MKADRAITLTDDAAGRAALHLVPDNLETLLTGVIAQLRALPDFAAAASDCRCDAIATIEIGRAAGLLRSRSRALALCRADGQG